MVACWQLSRRLADMTDLESRDEQLTVVVRIALAAVAAGAGVVHLAMVPTHAQEWMVLGVAFAVAGWLQLLLAALLLVRPTRRTLIAGLVLSAATVAVWGYTRTIGWPIGPEAGTSEAAGFVDLLCAGLEVAYVAGASVVLARPGVGVSLSRRAALAGAVPVLLVAALTAGALATPSAAHDHDDQAAGEHDHTTPATGSADSGDAAVGHEHAACTAPVTATEQAAADQLVAATRQAIAPLADLAAAQAAGYRTITPPAARVVHYGNPAYIHDGRTLDPAHPESLVYAIGANDRAFLLGAMYLLDDPLAAAPQPGGCLTQWHDHTNLCIAPGKGMVATVAADGTCPAGSSNQQTTLMLHVWSIDTSAGPFAELNTLNRQEVVSAIVAAAGVPSQ
jgi:hypothetical protein